jgi:hypothetical protein
MKREVSTILFPVPFPSQRMFLVSCSQINADSQPEPLCQSSVCSKLAVAGANTTCANFFQLMDPLVIVQGGPQESCRERPLL